MIRPGGWLVGMLRWDMPANVASAGSLSRSTIVRSNTVPTCPIIAIRSVVTTARRPTAAPSRSSWSSASTSLP